MDPTSTCFTRHGRDAARHFRLHLRRSPRSRAPGVALRALLRGGRSRRSRALARVGRLPARARRAAPAGRALESARRRWRRTSAASSRASSRWTPARGALADATRAEDDLFRFKVDFVRRRALPLLKGGAHVVAARRRRCDCVDAADRRRGVSATTASSRSRAPAARCWTREGRAAGAESLERRQSRALKRWCAARIHDPRVPRLGDLPLPGERSTTGISSTSSPDRRDCPRR